MAFVASHLLFLSPGHVADERQREAEAEAERRQGK